MSEAFICCSVANYFPNALLLRVCGKSSPWRDRNFPKQILTDPFWKRFCLASFPLFKLKKNCKPQICQYTSINIWRISCFIREKGQAVRKRFCELRLKIVVSIYSSVSLFILDSFSLILLGLFQVYKLEKLLTNKGTTLCQMSCFQAFKARSSL